MAEIPKQDDPRFYFQSQEVNPITQNPMYSSSGNRPDKILRDMRQMMSAQLEAQASILKLLNQQIEVVNKFASSQERLLGVQKETTSEIKRTSHALNEVLKIKETLNDYSKEELEIEAKKHGLISKNEQLSKESLKNRISTYKYVQQNTSTSKETKLVLEELERSGFTEGINKSVGSGIGGSWARFKNRFSQKGLFGALGGLGEEIQTNVQGLDIMNPASLLMVASRFPILSKIVGFLGAFNKMNRYTWDIIQTGQLTGEGFGAGLAAFGEKLRLAINPIDPISYRVAREIVEGIRSRGFRGALAREMEAGASQIVKDLGTQALQPAINLMEIFARSGYSISNLVEQMKTLDKVAKDTNVGIEKITRSFEQLTSRLIVSGVDPQTAQRLSESLQIGFAGVQHQEGEIESLIERVLSSEPALAESGVLPWQKSLYPERIFKGFETYLKRYIDIVSTSTGISEQDIVRARGAQREELVSRLTSQLIQMPGSPLENLSEPIARRLLEILFGIPTNIGGKIKSIEGFNTLFKEPEIYQRTQEKGEEITKGFFERLIENKPGFLDFGPEFLNKSLEIFGIKFLDDSKLNDEGEKLLKRYIELSKRFNWGWTESTIENFRKNPEEFAEFLVNVERQRLEKQKQREGFFEQTSTERSVEESPGIDINISLDEGLVASIEERSQLAFYRKANRGYVPMHEVHSNRTGTQRLYYHYRIPYRRPVP